MLKIGIYVAATFAMFGLLFFAYQCNTTHNEFYWLHPSIDICGARETDFRGGGNVGHMYSHTFIRAPSFIRACVVIEEGYVAKKKKKKAVRETFVELVQNYVDGFTVRNMRCIEQKICRSVEERCDFLALGLNFVPLLYFLTTYAKTHS